MKTLMTTTCLASAIALSGCGTPLWDANELNRVSPRFKTATATTQSVAASRPQAADAAPAPARRPSSPVAAPRPTKGTDAAPRAQASAQQVTPSRPAPVRTAPPEPDASSTPPLPRMAALAPDRTQERTIRPVPSATSREQSPRRATRFEIRNVILRAWNNMVPPAIDSVALFGIDPDVPPTFTAMAQPNAVTNSPPAQRSDRLDPDDIRLRQRIDVPGL